MKKIVGLFPLKVNGGITSWAQTLLTSFPNDNYTFEVINNAPKERNGNVNFFKRIYTGLSVLPGIRRNLKRVLIDENVVLVHAATSGSLGTLRDYFVGKICNRSKIPAIIHCHYGCITEDLKKNFIFSKFLLKTLSLYDQIWVLDHKSFETLTSIPYLKSKIKLTPNPIAIKHELDLKPKNYTRVGFIGNLIPTKGIYEVVSACCKCNVRLDIVGPGTDDVVENIKTIAGEKLNNTIFIHGRLPNEKALKLMTEIDILCLPTYYQFEAFPISILEAMSLSKVVISCPRAAIPDMLTDINGQRCGILVEPQSSQSLAKAIKWCQDNPKEADEICRRAFEKVSNNYSTNTVFNTYKNLYIELTKNRPL